MNIQAQCCGIILMLFLLLIYRRKKQVGLVTEQVFQKTLLVTMASVFLDILSIVAITHRSEIKPIVLALLCKLYIVSLVWVGYLGLIYVLMDLYVEKVYRKVVRQYTVLAGIASAVIFCLPIYYYQNERIVYTYGPSVLTTYVCAMLFVCNTFFHMIHYRKSVNPMRRNAVFLWMAVWMIAAFIQFMDNRLLLVGYACALGIMILFFTLENPDALLDRQIGCFNSYALIEYLNQLYGRQEDFSILWISLTHHRLSETGVSQTNKVNREIFRYLSKQTQAKIFKNVDQELVLIFRDESKLKSALLHLEMRFKSTWKAGENDTVLLNAAFVAMAKGLLAQNTEEILKIHRDFKSCEQLAHDKVHWIDDKFVEEERGKETVKDMIVAAIERDRVEVFYQPIYSTAKKKFVSAEALIRIVDEEGKIVQPSAFIDVAEETGLIMQLGEIVFDKTCQFIKRRKLREIGIEYIEVNLSVLQCEKKELAQVYKKIMDKHKLPPSCINLEITETASIQTKRNLLENMRVLIGQGVKFSLDDFGSGQANLNYIIDMPVEIVKLDLNMTRAYFQNDKAKLVVQATVDMVHEMGLRIVAEGVETKEQLGEMQRIGVDYIQGYYFSKPLPREEFLKFVSDQGNHKP